MVVHTLGTCVAGPGHGYKVYSETVHSGETGCLSGSVANLIGVKKEPLFRQAPGVCVSRGMQLCTTGTCHMHVLHVTCVVYMYMYMYVCECMGLNICL